jgi:hypothetical protein
MARYLAGLALLLLCGCGRYFPGPLHPADKQGASMQVNDDGSITHTRGRLAVSLQAMADEQLNRQFAGASVAGGKSTNPYTYGNWTPLGEKWTPSRFTVFRLKISNYEYPKVQLDPAKAIILTTNRRQYRSLRLDELSEYYRAYALGLAGNAWARFREQTDILRRTLYAGAPLFSGQVIEGFLAFPPLDDDVVELTVTLPDIAVRFNFADEPIETLALNFVFRRDVVRGMHPPAELSGAR